MGEPAVDLGLMGHARRRGVHGVSDLRCRPVSFATSWTCALLLRRSPVGDRENEKISPRLASEEHDIQARDVA